MTSKISLPPIQNWDNCLKCIGSEATVIKRSKSMIRWDLTFKEELSQEQLDTLRRKIIDADIYGPPSTPEVKKAPKRRFLGLLPPKKEKG